MDKDKIMEKLNMVMEKLKNYPNLFELDEQKNKDIISYFKDTMNCTYLPYDFIQFMNIIDGLHTEIFTIFSIEEKPSLEMKFIDYSNEEFVSNYLKSFKTKIDSKLLFFAFDNVNGFYAFKKDIQDSNVYYFNPRNLDIVINYNSFLDLVYDKIIEYISKKNKK
jgi:hypothetical protein